LRRRRATGGPAEHTFATLIGLELRPRRLRAAADLWREIGAARGTDGRDALWAHPDLLPTGKDLDDPSGFLDRDKQFAELLLGLDDVETELLGAPDPDAPPAGATDQDSADDQDDKGGPARPV